MAGNLKNVNVKVEISPFDEMDRRTERWVLDNRLLKQKIRPIAFSERAEIDMRRWDMKEIEDGLRAVARYDLKVFDVAVVQIRKEIEKARPRDAADIQAKGEKRILEAYGRLEKSLRRKLARAVDEVAGGPEDDRALADGRAALKKLEEVDLEIAFRDIAHSAAEALSDIFETDRKAKKAAGAEAESGRTPPDRDRERAYIEAARKLDAQWRELKRSAAEALAAIEYLTRIGKKIHKDKKASAEMNAFGREVLTVKPVFDKYEKALAALRDEVSTALDRVKKSSLSPAQAQVMARALDRRPEAMKAAKGVNKAVRDLSRRLRTLEKELG
jgi:hypothetical protein